MKYCVAIVAVCLFGAVLADEYGARQGKLQPTQLLKSYQGFVNDFYRNKDAYRLEYNVGDSSRTEQRTDSGEVSGTYAFVAPEGDEYLFKYEADNEGFRVEGDALPEAPEETDDVKAAKAAFFEAYERQLELAGSNENDDSEEDSDEGDDDDEESSEESSEESDEDDEDADEEEGAEAEEQKSRGRPSSRGNSYFSVPYPYSRRS